MKAFFVRLWDRLRGGRLRALLFLAALAAVVFGLVYRSPALIVGGGWSLVCTVV